MCTNLNIQMWVPGHAEESRSRNMYVMIRYSDHNPFNLLRWRNLRILNTFTQAMPLLEIPQEVILWELL